VNRGVIAKLQCLEGRAFWDDLSFQAAVEGLLSRAEMREHWATIRERARCAQRHDLSLHDDQETLPIPILPPPEQSAWNEFQEAFYRVLGELPEDLRAIFLMHVCLGWSFIRIAFVLHGEHDANLVSRPFYKARALVKTQMASLGHDGSPVADCMMHTSA
jgi:DNA-directed RNA polymerase specialized sigma24 family protein